MARPPGVRAFENLRNRFHFARHARKDAQADNQQQHPNQDTAAVIASTKRELEQGSGGGFHDGST